MPIHTPINSVSKFDKVLFIPTFLRLPRWVIILAMCVNLTGTFFLKTSLQKTQALSKFSVAFLMKSASSQDERWDIPFEAFLRPDAGQLNQMYSSNRQEQK